ncbi:uncharacterized protein LOC114535161 [Dendronephthya gigantea]|uniref:uncharacterized protein LOC114535161 n=1 Tax=Dendronephthya gigantea TaxID=151771 RepID=UPI0010695714|nr:uncharacterized protein LOC114535161 [Dendronephthya gigantea]
MSVAENTRSRKDKRSQKDETEHEETRQTSQADQNVEKVDNSRNVREDPSTPLSEVIKGIRFKRRVAIGVINRYIDATNKMMEEKRSRTAIKRNLQDIQSRFKEVVAYNDQLEKYLEGDEEILADMYILTDLTVDVNCITGMVQEHLEDRAGETSTHTGSETSSQHGSPPPEPQVEGDDQDKIDKQQLKDLEAEQKRKDEAAHLSELAHQKRTEAAQLEAEAEEAERQSEAIGGMCDQSRPKLPVNLPTQPAICGEEKAALYVQHLEKVKTQGAQSENPSTEDWIVEFRKTLEVDVQSVNPGKLPVRADVPIYYGDPLKWLSWSGLFKALVHNTKMTSEAKMGFLHTKLSKECDQVIAGLFPDDEGYAEALMLLRDRYGHPTTLQAAHLQVLKSLPVVDSRGSDNSALSFQSFVDQARSHLSVLKRYSKGESPFVSSLIMN